MGNKLDWRIALIIVQALILVGLIGWLVGRASTPNGPPVHGTSQTQVQVGASPFELSEEGKRLLEGIRCPSCKQKVVSALNCGYCSEMRSLVVSMTSEGQTSDKIKAKLLDRYGDEALKGRGW